MNGIVSGKQSIIKSITSRDEVKKIIIPQNQAYDISSYNYVYVGQFSSWWGNLIFVKENYVLYEGTTFYDYSNYPFFNFPNEQGKVGLYYYTQSTGTYTLIFDTKAKTLFLSVENIPAYCW